MRRLVAIAAACAAAAACGGGTKRVHNPGDEWLTEIKIEGNGAIETDDLEPNLALHRNKVAERPVDPYQLTIDTDRIRAAYLKQGFFDVVVKSRVDRAPTGQQTAVFTVTEGPRAKVTVGIVGLPPDVPLEKARALVDLVDGGPFLYESFDDAKEPLSQLVENAGYAHVDLSATAIADRARHMAIAQYVIDPGKPCRFGAVKLGGVRDPYVAAIIGRIAFQEGDRYSRDALVATQRAIYDLGRFATVRITPDRSGDGEIIPVAIDVTESTRHELKLGGGAGYEPLTWEVRARGGAGYIPADHPLWRLGADARVAVTVAHPDGVFDLDFAQIEPKIRLLASATRSDLFRPRLTGEIEGGLDYVTVEAYTSKGARFRLGLSSPLVGTWLQARVGWLIEDLSFTNISDYIDPETRVSLGLENRDGTNRTERIGAYQASLIVDRRDDPIAPRNGYYLAAALTAGTPYAGSAYKYEQVVPEVRGYISPREGTVFAAHLRVGLILGDVPVTERFFSGGGSSQRGFSERHLAPSIFGFDQKGVAGSVIIGGAGMIETGIELRQHLFGPLGANLFFDGGDVTFDVKDLDPDPRNLHWAAGAGLWLSFGGLKVRLEFGARLNRRGAGEPEPSSNWAGHLGVGETF